VLGQVERHQTIGIGIPVDGQIAHRQIDRHLRAVADGKHKFRAALHACVLHKQRLQNGLAF